MFFPTTNPTPKRAQTFGFGVRVLNSGSCPQWPVPCSHKNPRPPSPHFILATLFPMASKLALNAAVSELRFVLCQSSPSSAGTREFVSKSYEAIKKANPRLPVLIREAAGAEPSLFVRTAPQGVEKRLSLANLNAADVKKALESLAK